LHLANTSTEPLRGVRACLVVLTQRKDHCWVKRLILISSRILGTHRARSSHFIHDLGSQRQSFFWLFYCFVSDKTLLQKALQTILSPKSTRSTSDSNWLRPALRKPCTTPSKLANQQLITCVCFSFVFCCTTELLKQFYPLPTPFLNPSYCPWMSTHLVPLLPTSVSLSSG
jgi:hypothetical protein